MKKLLPVLLIFMACSDGRNEIMATMLSQKKSIEDSIYIAHYYEEDFNKKAREEMHSSHDSLKYKPLLDTSANYYGEGLSLKERLKTIEFSIDSLSKMK